MDYERYEAANLQQTFVAMGNSRNPGSTKRRKSYNSSVAENFSAPVKQRSQANARERDRTHSDYVGNDGYRLGSFVKSAPRNLSVNSAFTTLRTLIPTEPKDRKLSKIETLRLASSYISHLGTQLIAGPIDQPCLRIPRQILENDVSTSTNRHQVCTFCIAHKKTSKIAHTNEEYVCPMNLEEQVYFNQLSPMSNTSLIANNDLNSVYYQ